MLLYADEKRSYARVAMTYLSNTEDDRGYVDYEYQQLAADKVPDDGHRSFICLFFVSARTARDEYLRCHSAAQLAGLHFVVNTKPSHVLRPVRASSHNRSLLILFVLFIIKVKQSYRCSQMLNFVVDVQQMFLSACNRRLWSKNMPNPVPGLL